MEETLDKTTSGYVEYIKGPDGKLREYVRKVDHDIVVTMLLSLSKTESIM